MAIVFIVCLILAVSSESHSAREQGTHSSGHDDDEYPQYSDSDSAETEAEQQLAAATTDSEGKNDKMSTRQRGSKTKSQRGKWRKPTLGVSYSANPRHQKYYLYPTTTEDDIRKPISEGSPYVIVLDLGRKSPVSARNRKGGARNMKTVRPMEGKSRKEKQGSRSRHGGATRHSRRKGSKKLKQQGQSSNLKHRGRINNQNHKVKPPHLRHKVNQRMSQKKHPDQSRKFQKNQNRRKYKKLNKMEPSLPGKKKNMPESNKKRIKSSYWSGKKRVRNERRRNKETKLKISTKPGNKTDQGMNSKKKDLLESILREYLWKKSRKFPDQGMNNKKKDLLESILREYLWKNSRKVPDQGMNDKKKDLLESMLREYLRIKSRKVTDQGMNNKDLLESVLREYLRIKLRKVPEATTSAPKLRNGQQYRVHSVENQSLSTIKGMHMQLDHSEVIVKSPSTVQKYENDINKVLEEVEKQKEKFEKRVQAHDDVMENVLATLQNKHSSRKRK